MTEQFKRFLKGAFTSYQAAEKIAALLEKAGFTSLSETDPEPLADGGAYYIKRGGGLVAFRYRKAGNVGVVAAHTDSPCLKLKAAPSVSDGNYTRLNTEPYGGGLWYTFFDRPLKLAGRIVVEENGALVSKSYVGGTVVLPSLAVHMQRNANEGFSPDLQTELPLLSLGKAEAVPPCKAFDLWLAPDVEPFESGANGEFLSSPRLDDLAGCFAALTALMQTKSVNATAVAAFLDNEEIGSRTRQGAGGDLLLSALTRIAAAKGLGEEGQNALLARSFLFSLDNAHAVHPNHPEVCDPTNRPVLGGGVVIKGHAGGAYTTDALTAAVAVSLAERAGVKHQSFYNRSNMRSGSTLGAISLGKACIPSADIGLAQLAMHSAVETMATADLGELVKFLSAFYARGVEMESDRAVIGETV